MDTGKDIRVAAGLALVSVLAGGLNVKLRTDLPWVADPPPERACEAQDDQIVANMMRRISVQELASRLREGAASPTVLVDARQKTHYELGHIPGARSIPAASAPMLLQVQSLTIRPELPVVTYCDGGECELSESLALLLEQDMGCRQVMVLDGGATAWQEAGLPLVTGPTPGDWDSATGSPAPVDSPLNPAACDPSPSPKAKVTP